MMHISMGMREDLKIPLTMLSVNYLDKLPFKGSYNGKRFMFIKSDDCLKVHLWKDIYSFENTKEEDKTVKDFEYSKEGIEKGIDFVEETKI